MNDTTNQFCVIGLGAYGFSLAKSLAEHGAFVMAIDHDLDRVEEIKQYISEAIQFDATDPNLLAEHGVFNADIVIVAIGEAFEPVVLIAMELLKADLPRIIARAGSDTQETILNKIGIQEVIHPEKDEGERMARSLVRSSISDFFELSEDIGIYEIDAPSDMIGYSIADLKMRQRYHVNLLTIKRPIEKLIQVEGATKKSFEVLGVIEPDMKIRKDDKLVLMGKQDDIDKLLNIN
ncbi:TrkA family potassium uptake protein [Aliifodinibius sp. S!AR15-10]|uniref:potassium channel family protein n=1 Tax=Aliifodinibius sp. S!AR15-10 TaxID=2950437 RepID=UPI00285B35CB|nr:TrkA family potassium uptake protein [Aliifodinibius sp. S!AR15-10]MDR8391811.1 TrkA family potassium uptake protein [Aliifodinibius sp. S!AR15-10]